MPVWEEMQTYVGFDDEDARALRDLLPVVEPQLPKLADRFYQHIDRSPEASAVFRDEAQRARLHKTLQGWVRELLTGPHDAAYWQRRERIGRTHVRVGLPAHFMFTAMNRLRGDLVDIAHRSFEAERAWEMCHALARVTDLELAAMNSTYMGAHEDVRLRDLQASIIHNLPVTVLCIDGEGVVTAATRPSARLFSGRGEPGAGIEAFLPQALIDASRMTAHVRRAVAGQREVTVPRVVVGEGDDARTFRITVVPLAHELAEVLLHVEELTDVIQAEARARQAETLARVGALAANMAHEIRNPLTAISATLQVITRSFDEDDRRRAILGKVQEQVHRLDRLVSDLLGYARPTKVSLAAMPLAALAQEALEQSGVRAELELRAQPVALCDGQLVGHVLINLLQNARDAAGPEGRVRVVVGPGARITVDDDGEGVPEAHSATLFEPFMTTKVRGTGLGLAICRKMSAAMGARVELEAAKGELGGACFALKLREAEL